MPRRLIFPFVRASEGIDFLVSRASDAENPLPPFSLPLPLLMLQSCTFLLLFHFLLLSIGRGEDKMKGKETTAGTTRKREFGTRNVLAPSNVSCEPRGSQTWQTGRGGSTGKRSRVARLAGKRGEK